MLHFDRMFRSVGSRGNVCALVIRFESALDAHKIFVRLEKDPVTQYLNSLRLRRRFFTAHWASRAPAPSPGPAREISILHESDLDTLIGTWDCNPNEDAPFQIHSIKISQGPSSSSGALVFFWHHALMDARGGELLVQALLSGTAIPSERLVRPTARVHTWQQLRQIKKEIFALAAEPLATFAPSVARRKAASNVARYRRVHFSEAESLQVDATCRALGAEVFQSSVLLSSVARAANTIFEVRGDSVGDFFLTVPHNLRRPTAAASLLSNQVTFLFYRIPRSALASLKGATHFLIDATSSLIADGLHRACESFLNYVRYLPPGLGARILAAPSGGKMATFYFSDTGELLPQLVTASIGVVDAYHLPPHFDPPGFTAVCTRFSGRLSIMLIAGALSISEQELEQVEKSLRLDLLSAGHGSQTMSVQQC